MSVRESENSSMIDTRTSDIRTKRLIYENALESCTKVNQ